PPCYTLNWNSISGRDVAAPARGRTPVGQSPYEFGPRVVEVEREGNPPDEVVRQAEHDGRGGPRAAPDQPGQPDGAEHLPQQAHGREQPAPFGRARHLEVDDAVEADDHAEARENLRVVLRRQPRIAEQPLRVGDRVQPPRDVVDSGRDEDGAVKSPPCDHLRLLTSTVPVPTSIALDSHFTRPGRAPRPRAVPN